MRCEDVRDHLIDLTTADLTSADPQIRAHLDTCEACRHDVRRAAGAWSLLAAIPDEEPDSRAMRERFSATLEQHAARRSLLWLRAAVLIVAVGGGVLLGRQLPAPDADLNAMRQELRDVREMLALSLIRQRVASERLEGVSSAARIANPDDVVVRAVLDTLTHDPDVNVRLACIRALERFTERPAVREAMVGALTREESPLVTIALIDVLVETMDSKAIDVLRLLSEDAERDEAVRETAAKGLERLLSGGRI